MKNKIHMLAGILATITIATFFVSTVFVELFASHEAIATVKCLIVIPGLFILIPAIAATGGTGFALAKTKKSKLIKSKQKRMPFIALNGIVILIPCAIFLDQWATAGQFDRLFYFVQALELIAGAINLSLMSLNIRDGLRMTAK